MYKGFQNITGYFAFSPGIVLSDSGSVVSGAIGPFSRRISNTFHEVHLPYICS